PVAAETRPIRSRLVGLWHAHLGWMFDRTTTDYRVYAPDLLADADCVLFHRYYIPLAILSLALPYAFGYALGGPATGFNCFLLGGCVRTTVFHNITWGVNSIGHTYGQRDATEK